MEEGDRRAREFDEYVTRLKQWSKSDKSSAFMSLPLSFYLMGVSVRNYTDVMGLISLVRGAGTTGTEARGGGGTTESG